MKRIFYILSFLVLTFAMGCEDIIEGEENISLTNITWNAE